MNRRELVASLTAASVGAAGLMGVFGGQNPRSWPEHAAPVAEASHTNLLSNPSFETNTAGWIGNSATLSRVSDSAPTGGGTWVVKATCTCVGAQSWALNDSPNTVVNPQQGQVYTASAWVRAAAPSTVGKLLYLKLSEQGGAGANHTLQQTVTLTDSWQQITLSKAILQAGRTSLDTYLIAAGSTPGDSFSADLLSLTRAGDDPAPTATPTPEPTWTSTPTATPTATLVSTASPSSTPLPSSTATSVPTATSTATTVAGPSGEPMPLTAPPGWVRVFSEDFLEPTGGWTGCAASGPKRCSGLLGTSYYNRWWAYPSPWDDTSNNGIYSPHLVLSVHDGVLDKFIHTTADGVHRVAAIAPQFAPHENLRITYRFRIAQPIVGYKAAWLTWPDQVGPISGQKWPENGELDCPEIHFQSISELHCYMHKQNATSGGDQYHAHKATAIVGPWHTVTTEWIDGQSVKFFHNGVQFGSTTDRVPNTPHSVIAQTETQVSSIEPGDAVSGHVEIDWLVIETLAGS